MDIQEPSDVEMLNDSQRKLLSALIERFSNQPQPYLRDETYMYKWLKARKFHLDEAEAMLRKHLVVRKALGMDEKSFREFKLHPVLKSYYTQGTFGFDKEGRPVVYYAYGGVDPKGLLSSVRMSELLRTVLYWQETRRWSCQNQSDKLGKSVHQVIFVMDLKNVGTKHMWRPCLEAFQQIAVSVEQNSPEIIYKLFIINAPSVFNLIYKLIKPIVNETTQKKINVFAESGWKEALLKHIDADQIPQYYGGTAVDSNGDPMCSETIGYGGDIPESLYVKTEEILPTGAVLQDLNISRGTSERVTINVTEVTANLSLFWYFQCSQDVGFSIYRSDNSSNEADVSEVETLAPYMRLITHFVPEFGRLPITKTGIYVLHFDNSYSWLNGKTVKYLARLEGNEINNNANLNQ